MERNPLQLPDDVVAVVPMRNVVLFPNVLLPITVGRPKSIAAVQHALQNKAPLGIVLQKDAAVEDPGRDELHAVGTVANVVRHIGAAEELLHVVCQGVERFRIVDVSRSFARSIARRCLRIAYA